jgi:hypothetical protein
LEPLLATLLPIFKGSFVPLFAAATAIIKVLWNLCPPPCCPFLKVLLYLCSPPPPSSSRFFGTFARRPAAHF